MRYAIFNHTRQMLVLIILGQYFLRVPVVGRFFSRAIEYFVRIYFSSDISCAASIPKSVRFIHGHDIVIGAKSVIGERCKIFNGVTLGNKDTEFGSDNQPVIGCDCVISTGAKVLGGVHIGDRSIVGANAVVIEDVPADSIAVGVPAKILNRKGAR